MTSVLGVGFLGAGPVTQAIHLPVLASMPERFRIVQVMDVNARVSSVVAARCGAKSATVAESVLTDPSVDVVAICSPNTFHAQQVVAACAAGKRAILCEKPLAVRDVECAQISEAIERSGALLLVGTMHAFDPAYLAARARWREIGDTARIVQSSIYLPSNDVFINQATDQMTTPVGPSRRPSESDLEFRRRMFRQAMLGLAVHNIPLIRDFSAAPIEVKEARFVAPFGYSVTLEMAETTTILQALMPGSWSPKWRFRALGERTELAVDFPPSYVRAGSARARVIASEGIREFAFGENGYEAQWKHLYDIVALGAASIVPLSATIADLRFALDLADQGSVAVGGRS